MRRDGRAHSVKGLTMPYKAALCAARAKYATGMPKRRIREHSAGERQAEAYPPYPITPLSMGVRQRGGISDKLKKAPH